MATACLQIIANLNQLVLLIINVFVAVSTLSMFPIISTECQNTDSFLSIPRIIIYKALCLRPYRSEDPITRM